MRGYGEVPVELVVCDGGEGAAGCCEGSEGRGGKWLENGVEKFSWEAEEGHDEAVSARRSGRGDRTVLEGMSEVHI